MGVCPLLPIGQREKVCRKRAQPLFSEGAPETNEKGQKKPDGHTRTHLGTKKESLKLHQQKRPQTRPCNERKKGGLKGSGSPMETCFGSFHKELVQELGYGRNFQETS